MKIEDHGQKLSVSELSELSTANAAEFREEVHTSFSPSLTLIEIDLSETRFVDSCGLGALCALHRSTDNLGVSLRLLNPDPSVQQLFELTQMHQLFEIVRTDSAWPGRPEPVITLFSPAPAPVAAA